METIAPHIQHLAIMAVPFLVGITCHEVAHGWVSYLLGDPTPKLAGRLTANPLRHLDPMGTLALMLTQTIGWAKPVPVDPRHYASPRRDMVLVALAGPAANLVVAFACALFFWGLGSLPVDWSSPQAAFWGRPLASIAMAGVSINVALAVFNLLPIPPLDGSKIVAWLLPPLLASQYLRWERFGFIAILILAMTGALSFVIRPALRLVQALLLA